MKTRGLTRQSRISLCTQEFYTRDAYKIQLQRLIIFFSFFILCASRLVAAPVDFWFEKANAFYEQQLFDSAQTYYEKITASDVRSAAVYYNLGNTCFRLKKPGFALLYYEKAQKLSPNDPDIRANIRFVQSTLVDRIPLPEQSFIETILRYLHNLLPLNTQLWVVFFLLLALSILFAIGLYAPSHLRLWIVYMSSILLFATACCGFSMGMKIYSNATVQEAIVLSASADAINQPSGTKVLFTVHEGTKFRILKQLGDWSLVGLPTGVSGWMPTSSLGIIRF
jgi:tetratricopeptide (TPR) repeat protein